MASDKEFDSLTPQITIYRCYETLYIIPRIQCRMRKHKASSIPVLPIVSVSAKASTEEIGNAVLHCFERSVLLDSAPADELRFNHEVWRQQELGFTTYENFLRETTYIVLIRQSKDYEIIPSKRNQSGFEWQRDKLLKVPVKTSSSFLGGQILKALELADAYNPLIIKYRNPNQGEYPNTLSPQVIEQIQRLGGQLPDSPPIGETVLQNVLVPKALEMLDNVKWPSKTYRGEKYDSLSMVEFGFLEVIDELEGMRVVGIEDRALVLFAITGGGNTLLILDLFDPNPSNPIVYQLDHDWPGQSLSLNIPLLELLKDLLPDDE